MEKLLERLVLSIFDSKAPVRKDDGDDGPWIDDRDVLLGPARVPMNKMSNGGIKGDIS